MVTNKTQKNQIFLAVFVVVFLLVMGVFLGRWSSNFTLSGTQVSGREPIKRLLFKNEQEGYQFTYPASWLKVKPEALAKLGTEVTGALVHKSPQALLTVRVTKVSKGASLDSLPEQLDKKMASEFSNFQKENHQFVTVGKEKALRYTYSFNSKGDTRVKQSQQILVKGDKAFYLLLHANAADFDRLQPEWQQIADSFTLR